MRENRTLFLFVFATGNDALPETLDGQKELLLALYADDKWECRHILDELKGTQELYFDRVSQIRMPSWSRGRVALVGDAAFCVSLLAGQGSALAMTSAYVLAGELAKAGGRHDVAFREYEAYLRCLYWNQTGRCRALWRCISAKDSMGTLVSQSGDQRLYHPRIGADCRRQGNHRQAGSAWLLLATRSQIGSGITEFQSRIGSGLLPLRAAIGWTGNRHHTLGRMSVRAWYEIKEISLWICQKTSTCCSSPVLARSFPNRQQAGGSIPKRWDCRLKKRPTAISIRTGWMAWSILPCGLWRRRLTCLAPINGPAIFPCPRLDRVWCSGYRKSHGGTEGAGLQIAGCGAKGTVGPDRLAAAGTRRSAGGHNPYTLDAGLKWANSLSSCFM